MNDNYLPDDMNDDMGFGTSPGGDINNQNHDQQQQQQQHVTPNGNNSMQQQDSNELNEIQKLQLAERANEIYRQQLKYMQDHLASLRSLIQDKENIIENLMLRYDLGIINQDQLRQGGNLSPDEIEMEELRRKAEALAQRTILENFELREMVNELRDENFHLRNEIYELQDKINRQVLQINKLEKNANDSSINNTMTSTSTSHEMGTGMMHYGNVSDDDEDDDNDIYGNVEEDEDFIEEHNNNNNHDRGTSITGNDWMMSTTSKKLNGRRESKSMDHPANSDEARAKRIERKAKHERKESVKPPNLFDNDPDSDYMDEDAIKKQQERANKVRKPSIATPDIYGDQQGSTEEDESENDDALNLNSSANQQSGTKRRGSKIYMDAEAMKKRQQRQQKGHRRDSSVATPNIFANNYDAEKVARDKAKKYAPDAVKKRLERRAKKVGAAAVKYVKSHRRKESLAEKLLLGPQDFGMEDFDDLKSVDPAKRQELKKKARKEQRRKSRQLIKSQVGSKQHYSDEDVQEDKPQRSALKTRKKMKKSSRNADMDDFDFENKIKSVQMSNNKNRASFKADPIMDDEKKEKHRRDSSAPVINLGFEDPEVLLNFEKLKVKDLEAELEAKLNDLDKVKNERDQLKKEVSESTNSETKMNEYKQQQQFIETQLSEAVDSKAKLAQKCAMEIMRLTMILNTLQQMPKIKEIVQLLIDESAKDSNKNGSLLG